MAVLMIACVVHVHALMIRLIEVAGTVERKTLCIGAIPLCALKSYYKHGNYEHEEDHEGDGDEPGANHFVVVVVGMLASRKTCRRTRIVCRDRVIQTVEDDSVSECKCSVAVFCECNGVYLNQSTAPGLAQGAYSIRASCALVSALEHENNPGSRKWSLLRHFHRLNLRLYNSGVRGKGESGFPVVAQHVRQG